MVFDSLRQKKEEIPMENFLKNINFSFNVFQSTNEGINY